MLGAAHARHLVPFGVHRALELQDDLLRLGLDRTTARRGGFDPRTRFAYERMVAGLLPDGALPEIRTAVDVGANIGRWTASLLHLAAPSRVIAVEPQPEPFAELTARFGADARVELVEAAVGTEDGEIRLNVTAHPDGTSVLPPNQELNEIYGGGLEVVATPTVPLRRLDTLAAGLDEVSLLKIDVQGFERQVLEGGPETLARTRWVLLEVLFSSHYEGDALFPELHGLMAASGFGMVDMARPFTSGGRAYWSDVLYERR